MQHAQEWLASVFTRSGVYDVSLTGNGYLLKNASALIDVVVLHGRYANSLWADKLADNGPKKIYTLPLFWPDGTYIFQHPTDADLRRAGLGALATPLASMVIRSKAELSVVADQHSAWYIEEQVDGWHAVPRGFRSLASHWPRGIPKPVMSFQLSEAQRIAYHHRPLLPGGGELDDVVTAARVDLLPGYTARMMPDGEQVIAAAPGATLPF